MKERGKNGPFYSFFFSAACLEISPLYPSQALAPPPHHSILQPRVSYSGRRPRSSSPRPPPPRPCSPPPSHEKFPFRSGRREEICQGRFPPSLSHNERMLGFSFAFYFATFIDPYLVNLSPSASNPPPFPLAQPEVVTKSKPTERPEKKAEAIWTWRRGSW